MTDHTRNLSARIRSMLFARPRVLIGLCGPPGVGKSTISEQLARALGDDAVVVPMDGFHLASNQLSANQRQRRGAPETFDAHGYVSALERIRAARHTVYVPQYSREIEDPVAGAIAVPPEVPIVITEGNYLLHDEDPWSAIPDLLDEVWFVGGVDEDQRLAQLMQRHIEFGASTEDALRRAHGSDLENARLVEASRSRADAVVETGPDGSFDLSAPRLLP